MGIEMIGEFKKPKTEPKGRYTKPTKPPRNSECLNLLFPSVPGLHPEIGRAKESSSKTQDKTPKTAPEDW